MSIYILWDLDGTIVHNEPGNRELYLDAVEHVTGTRPTQAVDQEAMTDEDYIAELLRINALDPRRVADVQFRLDGLMRDQFERGWDRDACPGAVEALTAVRERGWTNGLLTGNVADHARYKLLAAGIDPELFDWERSYFGHETPARLPVSASAREAAPGHPSLFIADTPGDSLVAAAAGIPFLAVATGRYSAAQLAGSQAVAVIDDLAGGLETLLGTVEASLVPHDTGESSLPAQDAVLS